MAEADPQFSNTSSEVFEFEGGWCCWGKKLDTTFIPVLFMVFCMAPSYLLLFDMNKRHFITDSSIFFAKLRIIIYE